jgi:hypothetical protein
MMTTLTSQLPDTAPQKARRLLLSHLPRWARVRVAVGDWAFGVGMRLGDQNRPLALKAIVEVALAMHGLINLIQRSRAAAAQSRSVQRARPAHARRRPQSSSPRHLAVAATGTATTSPLAARRAARPDRSRHARRDGLLAATPLAMCRRPGTAPPRPSALVPSHTIGITWRQ